MKHLRLYENFEDNPSVYWYIGSADIEEIEKILSKFTYDGKNPYEKIFHRVNIHDHSIIGLFLGFTNKFDFWIIENDNEYLEAKKVYNRDGYEFQGEIKLIDGEIFIDSMMADVEKYNL